MRTFALENIEYIKGIQVFSKLIIDGQAPFDAFVNNLEDVYKPELASIIYYGKYILNYTIIKIFLCFNLHLV